MKLIAKVLICILLLVFFSGCCTLKGALTDVGWTAERLAENIEPDTE